LREIWGKKISRGFVIALPKNVGLVDGMGIELDVVREPQQRQEN
jgi:hypothetical protein